MDLLNTANVLCRDWDADAVTERKKGDDAHQLPAAVSSSFTAVNHQPTQLLTPRSSSTATQNQTRRATGNGRRRHNPAVAQYLGLGSTAEPRHLEKYAPLPIVAESPPPRPRRKRRRLDDGENIPGHARMNAHDKDVPNQRRISENFRVTKATQKSAAVRTKSSTSDVLQRPSAYATDFQTPLTDVIQPQHVVHNATVKNDNSRSAGTLNRDTMALSSIENIIDLRLFDLESDDCETNHHNTNDPVHFDSNLPRCRIGSSVFDDDDFDNNISDDDLLKLVADIGDTSPDTRNENPSSIDKSSAVADVNRSDHGRGSFANSPIIIEEDTSINSSQRPSKKFVSPVTLTTRLLVANGDVTSVEARRPIVRPPFPVPVRDRSPIIGLSSNTLLRTCFRIGEAINQGCQASKSGKHVVIELYARVLDSRRTDTKQHFTFCDLFHAKAPYIKAAYDGAIWKSVQLFEYDGRRLLQEGRICRCIGTMMRDGKEWVMTVLNVWEATWDDIRWVEGIVSF